MKHLLITVLTFFLLYACQDQITNNDSINSTIKAEKKPTPPSPEPVNTFPSLSIEQMHIAGATNDNIYIWDALTLQVVWSQPSGSNRDIDLADVNKNGLKELVMITLESEGKGRNKTNKYFLNVTNEGESSPSKYTVSNYVSYFDAIWDMRIDDLNGDNNPELIISARSYLQVFEITSAGVESLARYEYSHYVPGAIPWSCSIVDFDHDKTTKEILIAFSSSTWQCFSFTASSLNNIASGTSTEYAPLNIALPADLDNDGEVEVVGGGSASEVYVWDNLTLTSRSEAAVGFTWAMDICNFDNDLTNGLEIFVGVSQGGINKYQYSDGQLSPAVEIISSLDVQSDGLKVTDINNDGNYEFVVATGAGLQVFDKNFDPMNPENKEMAFLEELTIK